MLDEIKSSNTFKYAKEKTKVVRHFLDKFLDDWSLNFAAMLAYYLLISLLPLVVVCFGILGLVFRDYPEQQNKFADMVFQSSQRNNDTSPIVKEIVAFAFKNLSQNAGGVFSIGIVFAVFGSSRLFVAIDECMCIIYRLPERSFLRKNILAFGALFMFITLIPLTIAIHSLVSFNILLHALGPFGSRIVTIICSLLVSFIFFEFVYWVIPNKKMSLEVTWCGALIAALTFNIFVIFFPLYVQYAMESYTGKIGFAIILILFLFYFATIIILGAQINAFFFEDCQPLYDGLGTYLSQTHKEYSVEHAKRPLIDDCDEKKSYTN